MRLLEIVLFTILVAIAAADCIPSKHQWSCYTVQPGDTLISVAKKLNVNPNKLCDYNKNFFERLSCTSTLPATLMVPLDTCTPSEHNYWCYTVQSGDSFYSIAETHPDVKVSGSKLLEYNADLAWGQYIYEGMQIRIPHPSCSPSENFDCYTTDASDHSVFDVSAKYDVDATLLQNYNNDVIIPGYPLKPGLLIKIPKTCIATPGQYFCYKVIQGDSLNIIAARFKFDANYLCTYNKLPDCERINAGQELKIPIPSALQGGRHEINFLQ